MFIELKTEKGKLSDLQKAMKALIEALGFPYHVCHSLEEVQEVVGDFFPQKESMGEVSKRWAQIVSDGKAASWSEKDLGTKDGMGRRLLAEYDKYGMDELKQNHALRHSIFRMRISEPSRENYNTHMRLLFGETIWNAGLKLYPN